MRNVLIITVGMTPQIVTETVYALLTRADPFVPDAIYLVTTTKAASVFAAFARPGNKLEELYAYLKRPDRPPLLEVLPVKDAAETAVADVRTEQEAVAFGNTVTKLIAELAKDHKTRIHVSLAGGRKTMGWYAGAALSLFGRDHDELSHVLVEHTEGDPEALEGCQDFWWKTAEDQWVAHKYLKGKDGTPKIFNTRNSRIDLALIPFVRLRSILSENGLS